MQLLQEAAGKHPLKSAYFPLAEDRIGESLIIIFVPMHDYTQAYGRSGFTEPKIFNSVTKCRGVFSLTL
jgi:hypothetical protein